MSTECIVYVSETVEAKGSNSDSVHI